MTTTTKIAGEAMTDAQWLLDVMGQHSFTMPQEAFDAILSELKDARALLASKPAVPEGCVLVDEADFVPHVHPQYGSGVFCTEDCLNKLATASTAPAQSCGDAEQADEAVTDDLGDAARDVIIERQRQMSVEGWTPEHDDEHEIGELARAAACYAANATGFRLQSRVNIWPWDKAWWKPTTPRRDLVKAAALILAEIERIDRKDSK
ncbi:hypothetical protein SB781_03420 [Paraburkholderia sp. SIMBA_061]